MLKYVEQFTPLQLVGMLVFVACMVAFIIWVMGFRKHVREIIKYRNIFFTISGVVILICIATLAIKGLNMGLDFTGGTQLQLGVHPDVTTAQVSDAIEAFVAQHKDRAKLFEDVKIQMEETVKERASGGSMVYAQENPPTPIAPDAPANTPPAGETPSSPVVNTESPAISPMATSAPEMPTDSPVSSGSPEAPSASPNASGSPVSTPSDEKSPTPDNTPTPPKGKHYKKCLIQSKALSSDDVNSLVEFLKGKLGELEVLRVETVGPTIGQDLQRKGLIALMIALGAQLLYITFRFGTQFRFGIAADIALLHDLIVMVGLYSLFGKPVDSSFLAALLTIIGYSVMDSVVVFDRIRENLDIMKGRTYEETVNISLNQTMTRSSLASMTVIMTTFALYYFGGVTLKNFALALLIGLITGTYSSLFVASPLLILFDKWAKSHEKARVEARRRKLQEEAEEKALQRAIVKGEKPEKAVKKIAPEDYPSPEEVSDIKPEITRGKRAKGERKRRR